jgi:exodeoxyribonuclease V alpha subunit
VNEGAAAAASDWLRTGSDPDVTWLPDEPRPPGAHGVPAAVMARLQAGYADYLEAVATSAPRLDLVAEAFGRFRALCAVREGARGVVALNAALTHWWRAELRRRGLDGEADASPWFAGRAVIVLANDYVLKLFNGDIGIALPGADGELLVHFPDDAGGDSFRAIAPVRLPRHETAFAMTVHKSQGSEFDAVLVVLPETRSRVRRVALAAPAAVLEAAIGTATRRDSGLLARLREAQDPSP